jgi:hypothetical protein
MARVAIEQYLKLIPAVKLAPQKYLWSSYDSEADVLYINFKKPSHATDSELTEDDIIIDGLVKTRSVGVINLGAFRRPSWPRPHPEYLSGG